MEVKNLFQDGITYKAVIKEVLWFRDEGSKEPSAVVVYEVKGDGKRLPFNDFYIAVRKYWVKEYVMGVGFTPLDALEDAERNVDRLIKEHGCYGYGEGECTNPFREAIKALEKMEKSKEEGNNNILLNY
ncbi:MAG: hypothetical protein RXR18_02640 [Nitrososphaeria archaeon]